MAKVTVRACACNLAIYTFSSYLYSYFIYISNFHRVMVLGIFQCHGVLLVWMVVGQGPTVLVIGAGGG